MDLKSAKELLLDKIPIDTPNMFLVGRNIYIYYRFIT